MENNKHHRTVVLQTASNLVSGNREELYGSPTNHFTRVASMWSTLLGVTIQPHEVPLMMMMLKMDRVRVSPGIDDHYVDMAGYAALAAEVVKNNLEASPTRGDDVVFQNQTAATMPNGPCDCSVHNAKLQQNATGLTGAPILARLQDEEPVADSYVATSGTIESDDSFRNPFKRCPPAKPAL